MTRLIDADALIESMTKFSNATGEDMTHGIFYAHIAPTIDAVPVKHGKWVRISPAKIYECSECGQTILTGDIECYKFCHGCGARMDEE